MEEWIDLYDRSGSKLGRSVPKESKRAEGEYYLHVHVILENMKGDWLLQQRSLTKLYAPGVWDVTGGGVMAGESSREAAFREVREELGLSIPEETLRYAGRHVYEIYGHCILDVWYAKFDFQAEDCVLQTEEVQGVRMCSFEEIVRASESRGEPYRRLLENIRSFSQA